MAGRLQAIRKMVLSQSMAKKVRQQRLMGSLNDTDKACLNPHEQDAAD